MTLYVALLRGINVGGHRRVPMSDLRDACAGIGFEQVITYVQSGNVVFSSDAKRESVRGRLEAAIAARFGFDVDVAIRTRSEIAAIVGAGHPFADRQDDEAKLHVYFLAEEPAPERLAAIDPSRFAPDEISVRGLEIFVHFPNGAGRSKVAFDLGVPVTARNWRTVVRLLEMTGEIG